jgi:uncharacterized OsmC-like protein
MNSSKSATAMPEKAKVQFNCHGTATGKMRNELQVMMKQPFEEGPFNLASDAGSFHGGDASAPPPLALFTAGLAGCIMTQIRAFAKRMKVDLQHLEVDVQANWDWHKADPVYETAPHSFNIDITMQSDDDRQQVHALINAAKKGCFLEQTLGRPNTITHRIKTADGWESV